MFFRTSATVYAHIDCNSFYASCEVIRDPSLKGKFVCVGDQIVIAASYECKKLGIKTGTPIWEAERIAGKKLIKKIPDHVFYRGISDRLMEYLKDKFGQIEIFSIDELFVEITNCSGTYSDFAEKLKNEIYHNIGLPVSIGISNTRIRAKMFGDLNKPFGSYVSFDKEEIESLFRELEVTEIPYIAKGNKERLGGRIETVYDFYSMSGPAVGKILGRNGVVLWLELHGVDSWVPHDTNKNRKCIVSSRSFNHQLTSNQVTLWREIIKNFERAYEVMLSEKQGARIIGLSLRTKDFSYITRSYNIGETTIDRSNMLQILEDVFKELYMPNMIYRTTGVIFSELSTFTPRQLSIFDKSQEIHEHNSKLSEVFSKLKSRFGDNIVHQGFIQKEKKKDIGILFEV